MLRPHRPRRCAFRTPGPKWAELDPKAFLDKFPPGLVHSFLARMTRAPEEVGKVVNAYFRDRERSRVGDIFADANETERFLLLVRADSDRMVPRLLNLVRTATPEQLRKQYVGGRRSLVVEANEIAAFPKWFPLAEEILFALARYETEPGLGKNATKVWLGLFPIMSFVATPFDKRLRIIQERSRSSIQVSYTVGSCHPQVPRANFRWERVQNPRARCYVHKSTDIFGSSSRDHKPRLLLGPLEH